MDLDRKTAFQVLLEIEREKSFSNLALNRIIKENSPENPSFVRELVYGVLENRILLDYYLNILIHSGIGKVKKREKTILRMGLYQLLFMESVPDYAAVNETVSMARKLAKGREGFVNGVLRSYIKNKDRIKLPPENSSEYLSVKYSFSPWIIDMWKRQYGEESLEKLLAASNERPALCIRANPIKTSREELSVRLAKQGFEVKNGKYSDRVLYIYGSGLLDTDEYKYGLFSVQDEASVMACQILEPGPGENIIDTCAAPGGKSAAIGEIMQNTGHILSCDVYEHKLKLIEEQAVRLGIEIIETRLLNGLEGDDSLSGTADRVLVDAPCSGLGVIRRKPEIKYKEKEDISQLTEIQSRILARASEYVKPGGTLVYSTCTINKEENDLQIEKFINSRKDYDIVYKRQFLPTEGVDGFFICKMVKKGK